MGEPALTLEERVARLEGKLGWIEQGRVLTLRSLLYALGFLLFGTACGVRGLGFPNHHYQIIFAVLAVALFYHREWLVVPERWYYWSLGVLNVIALSMIFKLLIGSGRVKPLSWLRYPMVSGDEVEEKKKWFEVVPNWDLHWEDTAVSNWVMDLTAVQTFLFLVTLVGALFGFQPFASLSAILLILFSLPALISFDWNWVLPAIIGTAVGIYLQSGSPKQVGDLPSQAPTDPQGTRD